MRRTVRHVLRGLILAFATTLAAGPALADKPAWAGGNKHDKGRKHDGDRDHGTSYRFKDEHRVVVREYYVSHSHGHCPPGLAKKNNGCMPPGQAKKWVIGKPLPRDVVFYEVPQPLVVQIGLPPAGYRYVRVAGDILMIAIGTGMVLDAIEDLGR